MSFSSPKEADIDTDYFYRDRLFNLQTTRHIWQTIIHWIARSDGMDLFN